MLPAPAQVLARWQRNLRVLRRHLRHGRASLGRAAGAAKARELATLFRTVNAHLRRLGVDYVLTYGTLLGWHRAGRPLPRDVDLDFAAPEAAFATIWASRHRLPPGFAMYDTSHRHPGPKLYIAYRGWEADIYSLREEAGRLRTLEYSASPGDMLPFPREWFFPPRPAVFLDEATFVPAQSIAYLEFIYHYLGADAEQDPVTRYYRPRAPRPDRPPH